MLEIAAGAARAVALLAREHMVFTKVMAPETGSVHRILVARVRGRGFGIRALERVRLIRSPQEAEWIEIKIGQPLQERPVEFPERNGILAIAKARPTHDQSDRFFASATATVAFGSRLVRE